jgi:hypothetical protein
MNTEDLLFSNNIININDFTELSQPQKNEYKNYKQKQLKLIQENNDIQNQNVIKQNYLKNFLIPKDDRTLIKKDNKSDNLIGNDNVNSNSVLFTSKLRYRQVNIDSRKRDTLLYPNANDFIYQFPKDFRNIYRVRLIGLEFPNSSPNIRSTNNKIYWINEEDQYLGFPLYNIEIPIGNYSLSSLQSEIQTTLNSIKRLQGSGDYHYFIVNLNQNTDVSTFISLKLYSLPSNPLSTTINSNIITINHPTHGFSSGQLIYIINANSIAGISNTILNNNSFTITVIDINTYSIQVNIVANSTISGGGSTVRVGIENPFQFIFSNTYLTNSLTKLSSDPLSSNLNISSSITVYHPLHNFSIGQVITVIGANPFLDLVYNQLNSSFTISSIIDNNHYQFNIPNWYNVSGFVINGGGNNVRISADLNYTTDNSIAYNLDLLIF